MEGKLWLPVVMFCVLAIITIIAFVQFTIPSPSERAMEKTEAFELGYRTGKAGEPCNCSPYGVSNLSVEFLKGCLEGRE